MDLSARRVVMCMPSVRVIGLILLVIAAVVAAVMLHRRGKGFTDQVPHLYKILSTADWQASQQEPHLRTGPIDTAFIHLSTAEQLDRIMAKFWGDVAEFVVLKVDPKKFKGKLVFESNPGGEAKYYHLYDGYIPLDAVIEAKIIKR